jgi:hypothetical protein
MAPPPTVFIMNMFSQNIIQRYQTYMNTTHGYFPDEEQAELELLSLTDLYALFKPKSEE